MTQARGSETTPPEPGERNTRPVWRRELRVSGPQWAVLGTIALVVGLLLRDFVFRGRAFFERDVQTHWYAQSVAFFRAAVEGAWPVWDPRAAFGEPIWAYPTQVPYPATWLHLVMAPWLVYTLTVVVHLIGTGLGFYALARHHQASRVGALTGACAWVASGPLLSTVNMINNVIGAAWLPWIALAAAKALDTGRTLHAVLWGASLAAPVLAGSEAAFMGGLLTATDALRRVRWRRPLDRGNRRLAVVSATALLFALSLSAVQWLPTLELTGRSARQALPRDVRTDSSLDVLSLAQVALPFDLQHLPFRDHGTGGTFDTQTFLGSVHLGVPILALALAAFTSRHRPRAWYFGAVAVAALGFALGRYGPVYDLMTVAIPLLLAIRFPVKAMLLVALCGCLLGAMGFDGWRDAKPRRAPWWRWVVVPTGGLALLGLAATGLLWREASTLFGPLLVRGPGAPDAGELIGPRLPLLVVGTAAALLVALLAAVDRSARFRGAVAGAVALVAVGQLVAFHWNLHPSVPKQLYRYCPPGVEAVSPTAETRLYSRTLLQPTGWRRPPPGVPTDTAVALTVRDYLVPQVAAVCGFRGSFEPDSKGIAPPFVADLNDRLQDLAGRSGFLRLLQVAGVTHVASLQPGLPGLRPAASHETVFGDRVFLLAVPDTRPRSLVVDGVRVAGGPEAVDALLAPDFDPHREIVLPGGSPRSPGPSPPGTSRIREQRADRVVIEADMERPGHVVFLDVHDLWWTATVDGETVPVERADVAFRAVALEPGRHEIVFRYASTPVRVGLAWSAAALLAGLGLAARELRRTAREGVSG